jgi:hypothetical protein
MRYLTPVDRYGMDYRSAEVYAQVHLPALSFEKT